MPRATTQEALVQLTQQVEALVQIHNVDVEQKANQSRMWPKAKSWLGKNIIWVVGVLVAAFLGWLELRDQYRDHLRESAAFQERADERHASDEKALKDHEDEAKEDYNDLRKAIIETQVTTVEAYDQVRKEMRIVHPRLDKRAPKESPTLEAARDAAIKATAEEGIFKEKKKE